MSISVWGCPGGGASVLYVHLPDNPVLLYSLLSVEWRRQSVTWWAPLHAYDGASSSHKKLQPQHGRPHTGANGVSWPPLENGWKIKKRKHAKESNVLCLCYILRAIRAGSCRERRYADHIFIQIYFRMHHFVVKFSKFSSPQAARGHWPPNENPADVPESQAIGLLERTCLIRGRTHPESASKFYS